MDLLRFELCVFSGPGNASVCIFPFPWSFFPFLAHFSLLSLFPSPGRAEPGVGNGAGGEQLPHRQKFPVFLPHLPMLLGHSPEFTSNFQPCSGPGYPSFRVMEKTLTLHPAKGEVELICVFPGGKAVFSLGKKPYFPWRQWGNFAERS